MLYSLECMCGFETESVERKTSLDWNMMSNHMSVCKEYQKIKGEIKMKIDRCRCEEWNGIMIGKNGPCCSRCGGSIR